MLPLVEDLDVKALHVRAPANLIFLCGGPFSPEHDGPYQSLRDAFLRVASHAALKDSDLVLAETFTKEFTFSAHYDDILEFESDLAQIAELIILFCESEGSFAELGAFAHDEEISKRLLVVLRDRFANADSFITLGPIARLRKHREHSVFTIADDQIGIKNDSHASISLDDFKAVLDTPLRLRLANAREPTTFDARRDGHLIKLVVGLIQDYGALTEKEIADAISSLGIEVKIERLRAYLLCAKVVHWIDVTSIGFDRYYFPLVEQPATEFKVAKEATVKGRNKRLAYIREFWQAKDKQRFGVIAKSLGGMASE